MQSQELSVREEEAYRRAICLVLYEKWSENRTPGANQDLAETDAEDYVRHCILADLYQGGRLRWEIEEGEVTVSDDPEWETFWMRLGTIVNEFENATPKKRRAKLEEARRRSLHARIEMTDFAKANGAKPLWWARLEQQEQSTGAAAAREASIRPAQASSAYRLGQYIARLWKTEKAGSAFSGMEDLRSGKRLSTTARIIRRFGTRRSPG
jgi:hypothetical protein